MAVLLSLVAPSKHHSLEGREHGRTIPLNCGAVCPNVASDKLSADDPRLLLFSKGFWLHSDRPPGSREREPGVGSFIWRQLAGTVCQPVLHCGT
jgi:hypothetical protein